MWHCTFCVAYRKTIAVPIIDIVVYGVLLGYLDFDDVYGLGHSQVKGCQSYLVAFRLKGSKQDEKSDISCCRHGLGHSQVKGCQSYLVVERK